MVVYKIDRLVRALMDFAKLVALFEAHDVTFVSITQSFNTTTSMGRLTPNILLSFAQFEREMTGERIRDKIAASRKKGMWMGGTPPLGYDVKDRKRSEPCTSGEMNTSGLNATNTSKHQTSYHIETPGTSVNNGRLEGDRSVGIYPLDRSSCRLTGQSV